MHKRIAANTLYQVATKTITSGVGFILTIYIARVLGVSLYGDFTTITVFVGFFYLFVDFGANAIFLQHGGDNKAFTHLLFVRSIFALVLIAVVNISAYVAHVFGGKQGFTTTVEVGVWLFSITILCQAIFQSALATFQKTLRYEFQLVASAIGSLTTLVLVVLVPQSQQSLFFILLAFIVGAVLACVIALTFTKQRVVPFPIDITYIKRLVRDSLPLGLMLACNLLYFRSDIIILSLLKSSTDVGVYGLAYKFFDFAIAVPLFLSNALYPHLLLLVSERKQFVSLVKRYAVIFLASSLVIACIFWVIAPFFAWIRPAFGASLLPFRILLLSLPIFFMTSLLQWVLIAKRKQQLLLYVYVPGMVLNVGLNLLFIPTYSYIASAIITGVSELLVLIALSTLVLRGERKI